MDEEYKKREQNYKEIDSWLMEYKKNHDNVNVFYEDEFVKIYHIKQDKEKKELFKTIWEK